MVGGVSHYVYNLSRQLTERGHSITVITRGNWKGHRASYMEGIRVHRLPYLPIYPIHTRIHQFHQTRLFKLLEPDFDVVHIHHPLSPVVNTEIPVLVTIHSSLGHTRALEFQNFYSLFAIPSILLDLIRAYFRSMELEVIESADLVTTVSGALVEELTRRYELDLDQSNVLGNAVDTSLFVPGGRKTERRYVLCTGRLAWNKGLIDLVKGAKRVLEACPDVSYILTVKGPAERDVRRLVARMGMDREFSFVGFVDKESLVRLYQNSSVFVCPSYYEGLPTNLLEAMACGTPVVATRVGGISEVIRDGQNGFLVPTKNPEALADRIINLLNTSGLRARMGRLARETVDKCYSWDKTVAKALHFYESIT